VRSATVPAPESLGNNIWLLDLMEQGCRQRTGAYLIRDEQVTLIETGAATSHNALVEGLDQLGLTPSDLNYVIVTHVHLDHAGGAGQLMSIAPNATLVVHPRGARHMKDPSRLWAGAGVVYGERLLQLFGSVMPVAEDRILVRDHLDTLNLGQRTLTFYHSPGHANHHFTILDPVSDALFSGDALSIRYRRQYTGWGFEWIMPSTSPIDFNPDFVRHTVDMLMDVPFSTVYHTHYGPSPKRKACEATVTYAMAMADWIHAAYAKHASTDELVDAYRAWYIQQLREAGYSPGADTHPLDTDVVLNTLGLIHYEKQRLQH
jgi:glyoxylase-like metal-dependent hydrolase (beta-lactamase superfamily II)